MWIVNRYGFFGYILIGFDSMLLRVLACVTAVSALSAQTDSLPAPAIISPADNTELHNYPREVWLEWSAVPRAESYTIEIDCEHCCVQGRFCSEVADGRTFREVPGSVGPRLRGFMKLSLAAAMRHETGAR